MGRADPTIGVKYGRDELIRSILAPVQRSHSFHASRRLADGRVVTGLMETADRLVLKTAEGAILFPSSRSKSGPDVVDARGLPRR